MIRTIVIPENQDLSIHVPKDYVGRPIEVLLYAVSELNEPERSAEKKPSDFRGMLNLTSEQYKDFQAHVIEIRNEWDKDI